MVILLLTLFFSFSAPCYARELASSGDEAISSISEKEIFLKEEGVEIRATLPVIERLQDAGLESGLNARIQQVYDQKVEAAKSSRAKSISFTSRYKYGGGIISILLQTTITNNSARTEIDSINFNLQKRELTSITDVLGGNGVALAEKVVGGLIKKDPDKYNPNFAGMTENQAFYIENGNIVFLFNEYQVSSRGGIEEFPLRIDSVSNSTVRRSAYETKYDYGLKMIPLRQVCESHGYTIRWTPSGQSIDIRKEDMFITSIVVGQNRYSRERMSLRTVHTLESAPEVVNGVTYVPISFFDVIMDMIYSVDDNGNVLFTVYNAA